MKKKSIKLFALICTLFLAGCNLFETRSPEEPDTGKSNFVPPTEPEIVVSNFANAFIEKNTSNYTSCFSDTSLTDAESFEFIPSTGALSQYPSLFLSWDTYSERQYFNSLSAKLPEGISPHLSLSNMEYDKHPDSVIFAAEYIINIEQFETSSPSAYAGTIQLTITPRSNGTWSIRRWRDAPPPQGDTIQNTWSILKAEYYN